MARVEFEASPGADFKRVIAALKVQDKTLPAKFKRRLRAESKDAISKVKARALTLPRTGRQHSGLYKRISRGVRLNISAGGSRVRVVATTRNPEEAAIPRGLDTPKGWRHPVFGTDEWVQQPGYGGWFRDEIAEHRDEFQRAFTNVLEDARDAIAG